MILFSRLWLTQRDVFFWIYSSNVTAKRWENWKELWK